MDMLICTTKLMILVQIWKLIPLENGSFNIKVSGGTDGKEFLSCTDTGELVDLYHTDDQSGRQQWNFIPEALEHRFSDSSEFMENVGVPFVAESKSTLTPSSENQGHRDTIIKVFNAFMSLYDLSYSCR
mmetsp:Transcript_25889/g.29611  ORF Transcript_25889/g.29611 Transcript_25889/m.29611 type:complete len:129 (-) Transcript_25889:1487-1873(-)